MRGNNVHFKPLIVFAGVLCIILPLSLAYGLSREKVFTELHLHGKQLNMANSISGQMWLLCLQLYPLLIYNFMLNSLWSFSTQLIQFLPICISLFIDILILGICNLSVSLNLPIGQFLLSKYQKNINYSNYMYYYNSEESYDNDVTVMSCLKNAHLKEASDIAGNSLFQEFPIFLKEKKD